MMKHDVCLGKSSQAPEFFNGQLDEYNISGH